MTDSPSANNSATDDTTITLSSDLAITKSDGKTSINAGTADSYTIVATNNGPSDVSGATFADTFSAMRSGATSACDAWLVPTCPASGSGDISASVSLLAGGTATFTVSAT